MLCDVCRKNQAHIFRTEIINGDRKEQHLCESCASEFLAFSLKDGQGNEIPIGSILSGLLSSYARGMDAHKEQQLVCPRCGMTLSQFKKVSKMGCPECYTVFAELLDKNLGNLNGSFEYRGKKPLNGLSYKPADMEGAEAGQDETVGKTGRRTAGKAGTDSKAGADGKAGSKVSADGKTGSKTASKKAQKAESQKVLSELSIPELKSKLTLAIGAEDYDLAAQLRDLIHAAEGRTSEG